MELSLKLGGIVFKFQYSSELFLRETLKDFVYNGEEYDVLVHISRDYESITLPDEKDYINEDLIHKYYKSHNTNYCISKGRLQHHLSIAIYDDISDIRLYINDKPFQSTLNDFNSILRLIPLNNIFIQYKRLYLHSSQVCLHDKGIIFAGPSGIGKTTQSRLWEQYMGVNIICNDRTIIAKDNHRYLSYGLPIDGSSPIRYNDSCELKAIVVLRQSKENKIERLGIAKAIAEVMSQVVVSDHTSENKDNIMNMIIDLYEQVPVYRLFCTKDEDAVICLRDRLVNDGVMCFG